MASDPRQRLALLGALLGERPTEGTVAYLATNTPPVSPGGNPRWEEKAHTTAEALCHAAERAADSCEVYATLAWFAVAEGARKSAVRGKSTISAEVDDARVAGDTAQARHRRAHDLVRALPVPHITIDSGHGWHVHIRLPASDRVEAFADPDDGVAHVELLGRALRLFLEDQARETTGQPVTLDHCHGAQRVWRIPPGWNCKASEGTQTRTADRRLWKPVRLDGPDKAEALEVLPAANLGFLVPYIAAAEQERDGGESPSAATTARATSDYDPASATTVAMHQKCDIGFLPSFLSKALERGWPMDDGDQSEHDFAVAANLAKSGFSPETGMAAVRARRARLKSREDRAKGLREDYVRRTVARAYAQCEAPRDTPLPPEPFPLDALPPELTEFVKAATASLQCAPEALVLPLLTALGATMGNSRWVELKAGWPEPPLLWTVVILPSGKGKSPAFDLVLRPLQRREAEGLAAHRRDLREWNREATRYRKLLQGWERDRRDGPPPQEPERPRCPRALVSDTTLEAIVPILEENPRGVLLYRDELAGWVKSFDAYRQGRGADREQWLSVHRAGAIFVDRKQDREMRHVPHAFVAITGGIQPRTLRRLLSADLFESGLVARLLLAWPSSPARHWTEAVVPRALTAALAAAFERLRSLEPKACQVFVSAEGGGRTDDVRPTVEPVCVPLSAGAKSRWIRFYDEFATQQAALHEEDALGAALAKIEACTARLALILAHASWALEPSGQAPSSIDDVSMERAIRMARWFAREAQRVYARLREGEEDERLREAVLWLEARKAPASAKDLVRGPRRYRMGTADARADLELLVRRGWAWKAQVRPRGGGASTLLYTPRRIPEAPNGGDHRFVTPLPEAELGERWSPDETAAASQEPIP